MTQLGALTALEALMAEAEAQPNSRITSELRRGQRLGATRKVYRKYGRISHPYAGLEEFAWQFEVWTPELDAYDRERPHIKPRERGWRALPLGRDGEREARRLLGGETWEDILASRPPVAPLALFRGRGAA